MRVWGYTGFRDRASEWTESDLSGTPTHCNALQLPHALRMQSHCNALQHATTHCNILQHTAAHCSALQRTAAHCSTLQHTAAHRSLWLQRTRSKGLAVAEWKSPVPLCSILRGCVLSALVLLLFYILILLCYDIIVILLYYHVPVLPDTPYLRLGTTHLVGSIKL